MAILRIGNLRENKVKESTVLRRLRAVTEDDSVNEIYFWKIDFTTKIVNQIWKLFANDCRIWNSIKLMSCTGHVEAVVRTIFHYECVRSFVLSGAETSQSSLHAVGRGLKHNESIKTIRLLGVHFAEEEATTTFEGLTQNISLRELDLSRSHLAHGSVSHLSSALGDNRGLETIKFEQCFMADDELTEIVDSIYDHPTIKHVNFCQNKAHSRALEAIADLLESDECTLETLDLSCQVLCGDKEELDLPCLAKAVGALRDNRSLKKLNISGNKFSDEAVRTLSSCLSANSGLRTVEVNDSHISEDGIKIFAKNLPTFKGLKVLNIAGNEFSDNAAECLVDGLKHNRILESIGPIEQCSQSQLIEHYLDLNMAGRRAMQNDIPLALWPLLLARANHMSKDDESVEDDDREETPGRNENALYSLLRGPALAF